MWFLLPSEMIMSTHSIRIRCPEKIHTKDSHVDHCTGFGVNAVNMRAIPGLHSIWVCDVIDAINYGSGLSVTAAVLRRICIIALHWDMPPPELEARNPDTENFINFCLIVLHVTAGAVMNLLIVALRLWAWQFAKRTNCCDSFVLQNHSIRMSRWGYYHTTYVLLHPM